MHFMSGYQTSRFNVFAKTVHRWELRSHQVRINAFAPLGLQIPDKLLALADEVIE